jgi:hypothetical protein
MRQRRALGTSSAAILAAVLAACGGAVQVASLDNDDPDARARDVASGDAAARDASAPPVDQAAPSDAGPDVDPPVFCTPPPHDPYWDKVFAPDGSWGSTPVCGVVEGGAADRPATVNGGLFCALAAHPQATKDHACPTAICSSTGHMGPACSVYLYVDGSAAPIVSNTGECLVQLDAAFQAYCGAGGRRPEGLGAIEACGESALGRHFATQSALEAVSVVAFERLAGELDALGAPRDLSDACLDAAREEEEHAAVVSALAVRFGGHVPTPDLAPPRARPLLDLALENAVEGLVHETFAAAVAVNQARSAEDRGVRAALTRIAGEELGHAELSRRIHAWALGRLSPDERARVREAMREAIATLGGALHADPDASLVTTAGLPDPTRARAIHAGLQTSLWSHELQS